MNPVNFGCIQEEGSSTESLDDRDDSCLTDLIVQDEHKIEYTVRHLRNHEFTVIATNFNAIYQIISLCI
jgi:hypothetical protein